MTGTLLTTLAIFSTMLAARMRLLKLSIEFGLLDGSLSTTGAAGSSVTPVFVWLAFFLILSRSHHPWRCESTDLAGLLSLVALVSR
ncbi:hypothetical protein C8R44DRAFT_797860 [Mycena epipterygia]|nr:hypothetical protein C8R44DRAFT_797860 [Mycena epipterygia]